MRGAACAAGGREAVGPEAGAEAEHQGGRTAALQMEKQKAVVIMVKFPMTSAPYQRPKSWTPSISKALFS